jgi:hypothetical protein
MISRLLTAFNAENAETQRAQSKFNDSPSKWPALSFSAFSASLRALRRKRLTAFPKTNKVSRLCFSC